MGLQVKWMPIPQFTDKIGWFTDSKAADRVYGAIFEPEIIK
jgi:hypothetical protein